MENLLNLEINTVSDNNKIISIITSLCSILYSDVIDYEILLRFMNNILSEIAKIDKKINLTYDVIIHIEKNLMFVFDVVDAQVEREARQEHHKEGKREQVLEVKTIFLFTVTIRM